MTRPFQCIRHVVERHEAHGLPPAATNLYRLDWKGVVDGEEAQDLSHGRLIVTTKVVIDNRQQVPGRKKCLITAQLLHVSHVVGIKEPVGRLAATRDALSFASVLLECQRLAQVPLALGGAPHVFKMVRTQEAGWLSQNGDYACSGLYRRDPPCGGRRPDVLR